MHRMADSMVHEPSRFLGDSQVARNLATAHAVLAIGNQPSSEHPLVHSERAILEDAAELDGELLVATFTEPDFPGGDERVLFRVAARTGDASGPAQRDGSLKRLVGVAKVYNRILESGREVGWKAAHDP